MTEDVANMLAIPTIKDPIGLHRILSRCLLPRKLRDAVVSSCKLIKTPGETKLRRELYKSAFAASNSAAVSELRRDGFQIFPPDTFPGSGEALHACAKLYESYKLNVVERSRKHFKADFLVSVVSGNDFLATPAVLNFILSPDILRVASEYFGEVPVLGSINLMWSPPNATIKESQLFHRDGEDRTQLKLFLNIEDVTAESGPLVVIPAEASGRVIRQTGYNTGRLTDDKVISLAGAENVQTCAGPAGQLAAVDTSRCLHYGSRGNSRDRLVLFIQFVRFLAPKQGSVNWSKEVGAYLSKLDPVQRRVLNFY